MDGTERNPLPDQVRSTVSIRKAPEVALRARDFNLLVGFFFFVRHPVKTIQPCHNEGSSQSVLDACRIQPRKGRMRSENSDEVNRALPHLEKLLLATVVRSTLTASTEATHAWCFCGAYAPHQLRT